MNKIVQDDKVIEEYEPKVLGNVNLSSYYMVRVQEGLRLVMTSGTGRNYTSRKFTSAGKTGTSETFIDTNADGKMDTKTISSAFVMYAPFENPEYSIVVLSPNIGAVKQEKNYKYAINLHLNKKITQYLFEKSE